MKRIDDFDAGWVPTDESPVGTDPLTGLLDRNGLSAAADGLRADGALLTLLTVDVDGFTAINEHLGWAEGDRLLIALAQRCSELSVTTQAPLLLGRVGADEFAVVFANEGPGAGRIMDSRIRSLQEALETPWMASDGEPLELAFSYGCCELPADAQDARTALVHATAARLDGPAGRDNISRYDRYRREYDLLLELRGAVNGHHLHLHWQPQVDLASGRLVGAEALVRWTRGDGTRLVANDLIPVAEGDGLIARIDDQVLDMALVDLASWRSAGLPIERIAVNMSSAQFQRPGMVQRVAEALARHGAEPAMLDIEITESVLLCHVPTIVATLRELHALGVALSIDDFGTGYSSLAYLRDLPIDRLKIDRSFVAGIGSHATSREIVRTVVDLAGRIGLQCIAEGIETGEQLTMLRDMKCGEGQGFLLARPMPAADLAIWAAGR